MKYLLSIGLCLLFSISAKADYILDNLTSLYNQYESVMTTEQKATASKFYSDASYIVDICDSMYDEVNDLYAEAYAINLWEGGPDEYFNNWCDQYLIMAKAMSLSMAIMEVSVGKYEVLSEAQTFYYGLGMPMFP